MQSQTPIFDELVAEFGKNNKHYIDLIGGIKPTFPESAPTKNVEPLGQHANDETQRIDPIVTFGGVATKDFGVINPKVIDAVTQMPRIVDAAVVKPEDSEDQKKSGVYPRREKDDTASQTETPASPDDSA
jgi:hypothetical protein